MFLKNNPETTGYHSIESLTRLVPKKTIFQYANEHQCIMSSVGK